MLAYRSTVWSTGVELVVTDSHCLASAKVILDEEIKRMERLASRFRSDSELSIVNAKAGSPVLVSAEFIALVELAKRLAKATQGAVDPTVGVALRQLGYDRDINEVRGGIEGRLQSPRHIPGLESVFIDQTNCTLTLQPGTALDFGSSAKALTADRVAREVARRLERGVVVSLGGDVAVGGDAPAGGFSIGVGTTWADSDPAICVSIESGGIATSGVKARSWKLGRTTVHHIVDPATSLPAIPYWETVTVAASSCVDANAASTAAIVKGEAALTWLASRHLPSRLVRFDGSVVRVGGWPENDKSAKAVSR